MGVLAIEEDEDVYYYRYKDRNVCMIGTRQYVKEIMEILNDDQK